MNGDEWNCGRLYNWLRYELYNKDRHQLIDSYMIHELERIIYRHDW